MTIEELKKKYNKELEKIGVWHTVHHILDNTIDEADKISNGLQNKSNTSLEELKNKVDDILNSFIHESNEGGCTWNPYSSKAYTDIKELIEEAAKIGNGLEELNEEEVLDLLLITETEDTKPPYRGLPPIDNILARIKANKIAKHFGTCKPEIDREKLEDQVLAEIRDEKTKGKVAAIFALNKLKI